MLGSSDHRRQQAGVLQHSSAALLFCAATLLAGRWQVPRLWRFPVEPAEVLAFGISLLLVPFLWVLGAVLLVSIGRFFSAADISGSAFAPPSRAIAVKTAFLQNTLEQAVLAGGVYLILSTQLSGPDLAILPVAALLFSVGRAAFLAGYLRRARGRSFGMATTMLPTLFLYAYALTLVTGVN